LETVNDGPGDDLINNIVLALRLKPIHLFYGRIGHLDNNNGFAEKIVDLYDQ